MNDSGDEFKIKAVTSGGSGSAFRKYRDLMYGPASLGYVMLSELLVLLFGSLPGALGLVLRKKLYPRLFKQVGRGVVFGRNLTLRHAQKITLGDHVILDDNVVVDAKGSSNRGIEIGNGVYLGRNTIVYCKNGNITLGDRVNVSSNCQIFSSNELTVGQGTVIGAFTYLLSGGEYDPMNREVPFADQSGMETKGPLSIGRNCWLGAGVVVTDASSIGEHCVVAAGAVVTKQFGDEVILAGVPARVLRTLDGGDS
ncbi:MAG TPA: DapH/DapD/GlmU-related protein [Kiritimatiellia bacterium]|mgnify:CR=1 FL=1|nr:DapH/DapD/GlmU-related protein [Kiritimatiellia bacterium]